MFEMMLGALKAAGYEAYLVGGSVRNMLMGLPAGDYDICTSALPDQIKAVFKDCRIIDTGIKHGTVTVVRDGTPFEITTFRGESGYADHRHPGKVEFGCSLYEDLLRRDFTMNAVCFDGERFIDPLGGRKDIDDGVIRAVGDPGKRFAEDALRILRGLRFASVLGFCIDPATADAMHACRNDLEYVSPERIWSEFRKAYSGKHFGDVYLAHFDIFAACIPHAIRERSIFACRNDALDALDRLKADSRSKHLAEIYFTAPDFCAAELLYSYGKSDAEFLCRLRGREKELSEIIGSGIPYSVSMLEFDGNDAKALGLTGKNVGRLLDALLKSAMNGETENKKSELTKKAVDILRSF